MQIVCQILRGFATLLSSSLPLLLPACRLLTIQILSNVRSHTCDPSTCASVVHVVVVAAAVVAPISI